MDICQILGTMLAPQSRQATVPEPLKFFYSEVILIVEKILWPYIRIGHERTRSLTRLVGVVERALCTGCLERAPRTICGQLESRSRFFSVF